MEFVRFCRHIVKSYVCATLYSDLEVIPQSQIPLKELIFILVNPKLVD
jgi:hypothetical protein